MGHPLGMSLVGAGYYGFCVVVVGVVVGVVVVVVVIVGYWSDSL